MVKVTDLDCNASGLDDSFSQCCGVNGDGKSGLTNEPILGADGDTAGVGSGSGAGSYVNADTIKAGSDLAKGAMASFQNRQTSDVKDACGKKPIVVFGINKKKQQSWQECVDKYNKQKQLKKTPPSDHTVSPTPKEDDKSKIGDGKIMGMPKPLFYGLVGIAVIVGAIITVKVIRAKKG